MFENVIVLRPVESSEYATLVPLLLEADEDEARILSLLGDSAHTSYIVWHEHAVVGAVVMRWGEVDSEVEYIQIAPERRRQGYGHAIMQRIVEEARRRGNVAVLVGTDNTSLQAISFYQQCGFRMDHVRLDFFAYIQPPMYVNGLMIRDMLVLRYRL
ncbi:GNAT family N-acetyltransferase [Dictyobacter arantiisoli]|uniref:N-acetyltransferase domain-containing protein n=1 Tax=Dictyobacter arantiisoli TaxID=2014874 RepID=A0A5A5TIP9_9CHLR|nr:GNAT family N-acetyltransferase [Dictyobacter arantiisoli]GCF10859.1 hypothetical protein KDI_44230 [Dictyobacter arantiisoli]